MPIAPPRPCAQPGCGALVKSGRCEKHQQQVKQIKRGADKRRGTSTQRGYNWRWRKVRLSFLKLHPLCVHCQAEGVITAATVVDHIKPHKGDQALFWDVDNYQSLCARHHNVKTAREDGGWGHG